LHDVKYMQNGVTVEFAGAAPHFVLPDWSS